MQNQTFISSDKPVLVKKYQRIFLTITYFLVFVFLLEFIFRIPRLFPYFFVIHFRLLYEFLYQLPEIHRFLFLVVPIFSIFPSIFLSSFVIEYYKSGVKKWILLFGRLSVSILISLLLFLVGGVFLFVGEGGIMLLPILISFFSYIVTAITFLILLTILQIYTSKDINSSIKKSLIMVIVLFIPIVLLTSLNPSPTANCRIEDYRCIGEKAIESNNARLCDTSTDSLHCYYYLIEKSDNEKICNSLPNLPEFGFPEFKDDCMCELAGICKKEKDVIIPIRSLLKHWYAKNSGNGYENFIETKINKDKIDNIVEKMEKEKNKKIDYRIFNTKHMYVIKLKIGDINNFEKVDNFICSDPNFPYVKVYDGSRIIKIQNNNFESQTDCQEKVL